MFGEKKVQRRILFYVLYSAGVCFLVLLATEFFVRTYLLKRINLNLPIRLNQDGSPLYSLIESDSALSIRNGRRELATRGQRNRRVMFVGDSATYGSIQIQTAQIFTELMQSGQDVFDAYNFGVFGYGLPEVASVVDKISRSVNSDVVFYLYNFNDAYVAMPGYLSALTSPNTRIARLDEYDGWGGKLVTFLKDHIKTVFVLNDLWQRLPSNSRGLGEKSSIANTDSENCYDVYPKTTRVYELQRKLYSDETTLVKIEAYFRSMKSRLASRKIPLLVMLHFDYQHLVDPNKHFGKSLENILRKTGIEYIDSYPFYHAHFRECGFYMDGSHLGELGNRYVAEFVQDHLLSRFFTNKPL